VPIRKSVAPDYIICLEDGKKLKMLKRHLKTAYDMTPGQYRERWGLPADYPMVAPNYAAQRRDLAKKIGLGTAPRQRGG
jgi:predicted transcriptional regulator